MEARSGVCDEPTRPGECDQATIECNVGNVQSGKVYWPVSNVLIAASDPETGKVTLSAIGVDRERHEYEDLTWGDEDVMWVYCPSSLPSEAIYPTPGELPEENTMGTLYLEDKFIASSVPQIAVDGPKWPAALGIGRRFAAPMKIAPTRLVLTGIELASNGVAKEASVDLMDPRIAPKQQLTIGDGALQVHLTHAGFRRFRVIFPYYKHLEEAVQIILARRDADAIVHAWEIVAGSAHLLRRGQWPESEALEAGAPGREKAIDLLRKVLDVP